MYKLALVFLAGALQWGTAALAQAEVSGRARMDVVWDYLGAVIDSEGLQRMQCGRFLLVGDRLNWEQAVSEARARLAPPDRERFDKLLQHPRGIEMREQALSAPPKTLKTLMDQGFSLDYACGLMSGMTLERNSAKVERFRALD